MGDQNQGRYACTYKYTHKFKYIDVKYKSKSKFVIGEVNAEK